MAALSNIEGSARRTRRVWETTPLAPPIARHAPLTLLCETCGTPRCATAERVVLWHETVKADGSGKPYECAGVGSPGLDWNGE